MIWDLQKLNHLTRDGSLLSSRIVIFSKAVNDPGVTNEGMKSSHICCSMTCLTTDGTVLASWRQLPHTPPHLNTITDSQLPQRPYLLGETELPTHIRGSGESMTSPEVGYQPGGSMESAELSHFPITIHNFSDKICDKLVHFHVMSLRDCFFLWVGSSARLCNLAVAMCSRYDSMPLSSLILGDKSDTTSGSVAQRLAKKTKKQVFASINIPINDSQLMLLIEKRIKEEMESFPEKF